MDDAVRFPFGRNWQSFVQAVDADAIAQAEHGLKRLFPDLRLKSFFDIGCGSGLSLLAASRLGAIRGREPPAARRLRKTGDSRATQRV